MFFMEYLIYIKIVLAIIFIMFIIYNYKRYKRSKFYKKYASISLLANKDEQTFYHRLRRQLPSQYRVAFKVDIDDLTRNVKIGKQLECRELQEKFAKVQKHDVDLAILNKKNKFICAINITEKMPEGVPEIFGLDANVEMLLAELDIKMFKFTADEQYDMRDLLSYILSR